MKRFILLTALMMPMIANAAPVSPLKQSEKPSEVLKQIDDVLAGKFDKAVEYRPPLPLTQKA